MLRKPGRIKGVDPRKKKAKDNAKRTTRRHKIAESAARKIKRHGNQTVRRAAKVRVLEAGMLEESAASAPKTVRRSVQELWSAENASERRERRQRERRFLDKTASDGPKGRRRANSRIREWTRN